MLTAADLIRLPYTPDLTEGGIAYAVRSLPYTYNRNGTASFDRLRRIVASAAVELAFRHYLDEKRVPFEVKNAPLFTDPERYDVRLGGHRCDLQAFLISRREQIAAMRGDPGVVLEAPALVPSDLHAAEGHGERDLYLFAFLAGLVASSLADLRRALEAGQPLYQLHCMPAAWARPQSWNPLGPLALKSESDEPVTIELAGQDELRGFLTRRVELPPRTRTVVNDPFFSLSSIHVDRLLEFRLGVHSPRWRETHIINWHEWGNIRVYGIEILLAGYIPHREFSDRAVMIQPGSRVFQFDGTHMKNLAVPVSELKPLGELCERVRASHEEKQAGIRKP